MDIKLRSLNNIDLKVVYDEMVINDEWVKVGKIEVYVIDNTQYLLPEYFLKKVDCECVEKLEDFKYVLGEVFRKLFGNLLVSEKRIPIVVKKLLEDNLDLIIEKCKEINRIIRITSRKYYPDDKNDDRYELEFTYLKNGKFKTDRLIINEGEVSETINEFIKKFEDVRFLRSQTNEL